MRPCNTVHSGCGVTPGQYTGPIRVEGPHPVVIRLELTVWPFQLPLKRSFVTMGWSLDEWFFKGGVDPFKKKVCVLLEHGNDLATLLKALRQHREPLNDFGEVLAMLQPINQNAERRWTGPLRWPRDASRLNRRVTFWAGTDESARRPRREGEAPGERISIGEANRLVPADGSVEASPSPPKVSHSPFAAAVRPPFP